MNQNSSFTEFSYQNRDDLELARFQLELRKFDLAKKNVVIDIIYKLAIPLALLVIAYATYSTNTAHVSAQIALEEQVSVTALKQKEEELFLRKSDSEHQRRLVISAFLQNHLERITSKSDDSWGVLIALVEVAFPADEADEVLLIAAKIRQNAPSPPAPSVTPLPLGAFDYKLIGKQYASKGDYEAALQNFETSTLLGIADPEAWNFKAYAELRTNRNDAALQSISTAINLQPTDLNLRNILLLNATKILCALGRSADAYSYINQGLAVSSSLYSLAQKDGELRQRCNFAVNPR